GVGTLRPFDQAVDRGKVTQVHVRRVDDYHVGFGHQAIVEGIVVGDVSHPPHHHGDIWHPQSGQGGRHPRPRAATDVQVDVVPDGLVAAHGVHVQGHPRGDTWYLA